MKQNGGSGARLEDDPARFKEVRAEEAEEKNDEDDDEDGEPDLENQRLPGELYFLLFFRPALRLLDVGGGPSSSVP